MATLDADTTSRIALVGTVQPIIPPTLLTAGPLSAEFQQGALRYIRYRDQEIIRAVSFLVRDENWGTYDYTLSNVQTTQNQEGFTIRFDAACGPSGNDLQLTATIRGQANGTLDFDVESHINTPLQTNRTGFVILHPIEVSGLPVLVETVDGQKTAAHFPVQIDPVQPFMSIRALTTTHACGLKAEVRMEGDTFEMEDQRNWSDASFKTYVRPLALPWPYTLAKGETLRQAVRIHAIVAEATMHANTRTAGSIAHITIEQTHKTPAPALGIGIRAEHVGTALARKDALASLNPAYFIGHIDLRCDNIEQALAGFAQLTHSTNVPYILEIVLGNHQDQHAIHTQLREVARYMADIPLGIQLSPAADLKAVLPGSIWPPCPSFASLSQAAKDIFPGIAIGGGTLAYFTELNRKRPDAQLFDYITFTTCPIVHAADDVSVMETLTTLPYIANSVKKLYPTVPFYVGPSTIAARDNPYGAATLPNPDTDKALRICLTDNDPRQRAAFAAAWSLGYFAQFAAHGASHIALSELTGPRGLFANNVPTPLFHVLASLTAAKATVQVKTSHDASSLYTYAAQDDHAINVWIANTSTHIREIHLNADDALTDSHVQRWRIENGTTSALPLSAVQNNCLVLHPYETVQVILKKS